jgi:hypothetical protein
LAKKKVEETPETTVTAEVPEQPETPETTVDQEEPVTPVETITNEKVEFEIPVTVEFSHRFLFATYDLGFARVDFCNGRFSTSDPQIIDALRKHSDFGRELIELGKKV